MAKDQRVQLAENAIVDLTTEYPTYSGGGRGIRATVGKFSAKSTNKANAAEALLALLQREYESKPAPEPKAKRQAPCGLDCLFAHREECDCQCGGENHMTGWVLFEMTPEFGGPKRVKGGRLCGCGCGQMTKGGHFVQGHDRKFHQNLAPVVENSTFFLVEDKVGFVLSASGRAALGE